jgi:hypothetical protein
MATQAALREDFNKNAHQSEGGDAGCGAIRCDRRNRGCSGGANDDAIGWVVSPGHMPPVIEALGKGEPTMVKHLGESDILQPLRFNDD